MDENHQDLVNHTLVTTEDKIWLPPSYTNNKPLVVSPVPKKRGINWGFAHKSFWEWLLLSGTLLAALGAFAIPFVVTVIGLNFTQQQAQLSIAASERQHQTDLQIAQDQQQATILQTYLDNIQDLLLNYNLSKSSSFDPANSYYNVAILAQARTLTALYNLNSPRKATVVRFLYQAHLIGYLINPLNPQSQVGIIDLTGADLNGIDLHGAALNGADLDGIGLKDARLNNANLVGAKLNNADLDGAELYKADLSGAELRNTYLRAAHLDDAKLRHADLSNASLGCPMEGAEGSPAYLINADLSGANLSGASLVCDILTDANLSGANLSGAWLVVADLRYANLSNAKLSDAKLDGANLSGAEVTQEQLAQARSLDGATMPDGSKHP